MTFLIYAAYILISMAISTYLYSWVATFKEMSEFSEEDWDTITEEVNESGKEVEHLSEAQKKTMRYVNKVVFLTIGCLVWIFMGITIGRIASEVTEHSIWKWVVYIGMYFLFLRIPFGVTSRLIQSVQKFKQFPEKALFSILMIGFYILSICCYNALPGFLKWHLAFLP